MKDIRLKNLRLENFKGQKDISLSFESGASLISGANATGKTTLIDAFLWLLFDHDSSGNAKFGIRPVDKGGKEIDNIEISVTGKFRVEEWKNVNDVYEKFSSYEIEFKKIQKQKWTKHRGSSAPTFEGNVNSFEIDGFPQSKAEYQKRIQEIIPEDIFRLIADLRYFTNLDWKDKRKLLLDLCGDVTDLDVFADDPEYWEPIKADVEAAGADKAREKAKKAMKELNKNQNEIPIRIDEASKQIQIVPDTFELLGTINSDEVCLSEIKSKISQMEKDADTRNLKAEIGQLENERSLLLNDANSAARVKYESALKEVSEYNIKVFQKEQEITKLNGQLMKLERQKTAKENELNALSIIYHNNKTGVPFDESKTICPTCGQKLPQERIDEIIQNHNAIEADRIAKMQDSVAKGKTVKAEVKSLESQANEMHTEISEADKELKAMNEKLAFMKANAEKHHIEIVPDSVPGYAEITNQIEELKKKVDSATELAADIADYKQKALSFEQRIDENKSLIVKAEAIKASNKDTESRIESLKEEQRDIGQKIAETEQKLILLEEFSMKKSELLSKKITSCFELANFSLFSKQINGGLVEECEITLKGVRYKDMNSGHRIVVAMDIIKAFSNKLGVCAPLFVDNAESVNDFNLPDMPCQLILMKVTDDQELKIEGGTLCAM